MLNFNRPGVAPELQARKQWIAFNIFENIDEPHKTKKLPALDDWTNPATWRSLDDVLASLKKNQMPGIVYGNGLVGLDNDNCVVDGQVDREATALIRQIDSYSELSLSGTGTHTFAFSDPFPTIKRTRELWCAGHCVVVTGQHIAGTPTDVMHRPNEVATVARQLVVPGSRKTGTPYQLPEFFDEGQRTTEFFTYLRYLKLVLVERDDKKRMALAWEELQHINATRCRPPFSDSEMENLKATWLQRSWDHRDRDDFKKIDFIDPSEVYYGD